MAAEKRRESRRAQKTAGALVAAGAFVLGAPAVSSAATFTVNSTGDTGATTCDPNDTTATCELRDAINQSNANSEADTILFDSSITGDTITLAAPYGALVVDESNGLDINAGSAPDGIYIDGAYNSMVLDVVNSGAGLTLSGLTIQHGEDDPAGGIYVEGSHFGQFSEGTYVHLTNSEVTGNLAHGSQVDKYSFASGGGITNRGYLVVDNSTIYDNESVASGDIYPVYGGGGINNLGRAVISDSTISSNDADQFGGGIFQGFTNYPTYLNVSNTEISDNLSYLGGGVATSSFFGVTPDEGSVGNVGSNIGQLVDSTITGNHAVSGAGVGIKYLGGNAKWKISHSTISDNETSDNGGNGGGLAVGLNYCCGPYNFTIPNGTLNVLDSTISGNYASNSGGGASIGFNAQKYEDTVQFNNSTIASNEANNDGGGLYLGYTEGPYYFSTPVFSTIVGDNTASGVPNDLGQGQTGVNAGTRAAATGGAFDLSFSLVEVPGDAQFTETPAGSNIFGLDPQLGPLADNGGPTFTHLPSINSPVVDKGSAPGNLTTDQRGDLRTVDTGAANAHDGTDIGAVELPTGPPGPTPPAPTGSGAVKVGTLKKKHKKRRRVLRTKNDVAKVRITFRSNNPAVTFRCSVDGGPFEPCTSPFVTKLSSAPGKGKNHNVAIQQVDAAGNQVGHVRVFKFRVVLKD